MNFEATEGAETKSSAPFLSAQDRLIVALDFPSSSSALEFVDRLEGTCRWFKVGLELFCGAGPSVVHALRERGYEVFLDLKLHDIPNTVAGAVRSVAETGASLLTIHAAGGERMMAAAAEAAQRPGSPRLLAVTVLTSMDTSDLAQIGVSAMAADQVRRLATLAQQSGIDGMVCSSDETSALREILRPDTLLVVPGIRPAGSDIGDQRRVATPSLAIRAGASMLVVGRPITQSRDPAATAADIQREINAALQERLESVISTGAAPGAA